MQIRTETLEDRKARQAKVIAARRARFGGLLPAAPTKPTGRVAS